MPTKQQKREERQAKALAQQKSRWLVNAFIVVFIIAAIGLLIVLTSQPAQPLASAEVIALGREVYQENCAACHGDQGQGHVLEAAPALDSSEHAWHHPDGQIQLLIISGGQTMPAFNDQLADEEIVSVIRYLQTWWTADQLNSQQEASEQVPLQ